MQTGYNLHVIGLILGCDIAETNKKINEDYTSQASIMKLSKRRTNRVHNLA